jgi:hypothetical protein
MVNNSSGLTPLWGWGHTLVRVLLQSASNGKSVTPEYDKESD